MLRNRAIPTRNPATATVMHRKPSLDFSVTGLVYCSMMMFMGLAAMNSQASLLFGVFGLMIGILLVSGFISRVVLRRLHLHRVLPELAVVGQPTTVTYEFANDKRFWPSLSVCLAELDGAEAFTRQPQSYMLHAAARTVATIPTEVMPKRRGLHEMDRYQLSTSFPFGFIKRAVERRQKDLMLIYPALGQLDPKFLSLCRSADTSGATMRPRRGGQDEFYGVKEHRNGENPRHIYWRRSARTGVLVAKEMTQVSPPRLLILVDTHIAPELRSVQTHADIERGIAMAATLASQALEAGLSVGLLAWSDDGWTLVQPARGKRHRRDLLAVLARLPLNTDKTTQDLLDESRSTVETGATPVLITPREVQLGLSDAVRSGLVVASARPDGSRRWFNFAPTVFFDRCMPVDQEPMIGGQGARKREKGKAKATPAAA
ncbi:MAG TPA: DUF58 domain-containing protein [Tepidisphaeraceae bacterium]|nr:DUF58 domain-containing protein [Tepidisphaeraceae bacterium]